MRLFQRFLPFTVILAGFGTSFLSTRFDGGFLRGLFQGATLALMVIGAYLLWALVFRADDTRGMWRPSQDGRHADRS